MSNIEDDLKEKGFIEAYKQIKNNASIIKSIDKDFFFELVDYLLSEREQDKARIKELEAKLEFKKYGDLDEIEFEEYMSHFIPKQKVKDVLQNNRNEIFSFTYVDDEQFKPYTMQIDRINKIENELLEEGE